MTLFVDSVDNVDRMSGVGRPMQESFAEESGAESVRCMDVRLKDVRCGSVLCRGIRRRSIGCGKIRRGRSGGRPPGNISGVICDDEDEEVEKAFVLGRSGLPHRSQHAAPHRHGGDE